MLSLQADIAQAIANEVRIEVTPQQKQDLHASLPVQLKAQPSFSERTLFLEKRTAEGVHVAIKYFSDTRSRASGFARAYAGMAECYECQSTVFTTQEFRRANLTKRHERLQRRRWNSMIVWPKRIRRLPS